MHIITDFSDEKSFILGCLTLIFRIIYIYRSMQFSRYDAKINHVSARDRSTKCWDASFSTLSHLTVLSDAPMTRDPDSLVSHTHVIFIKSPASTYVPTPLPV